MKAIVYEKYGSSQNLKLTVVEKPVPGDDEVLVKVHAVSVNNWDWDRLTGRPYLYRLISGLSKPKLKILGADVAGTVETVGNNVTRFKPGDAVYGDLSEGNWGGFAEYALAKENYLTTKPISMSFEQAAAIPQAGVMAVQAILDQKEITQDNKILMNGAAGGIGTFVIQLAKMLGAHITTVDRGDKLDFLQVLGADTVIDYQKENFTKNGQTYDLIIDVVANQSISDYKRSLNATGAMSVIGGKITTVLKVALLGSMLSGKDQKISLLMHKPNKYLDHINELFESGKIKPVIDKIFPLEQTAKAIQYIGDGNVMGKVIIKVI